MRPGLRMKLYNSKVFIGFLFTLQWLVVLLVLFLSSRACFGADGFDMRYVPRGWSTPEAGYWLPEASGRMIAYRWSQDVAELDVVSRAFAGYRKEVEFSILEQQNMLKQLELEILQERRRANQAKNRSMFLGVVIGVGVGSFLR